MNEQDVARLVGDLIDRRIQDLSPRPRPAVVTGVSGGRITVSRNGGPASLQEFDVVGLVPDIGDKVIIDRDESGADFIYSLAARSVGTASGNLATVDYANQQMTIRDDGTTEVTDPLFLNILGPLVTAPSGAGATIGITVGTTAGTVAAGNDSRFGASTQVRSRNTSESRAVTQSVTSGTFSTFTSTSATLNVDSGTSYDITIIYSYSVLPAASGNIEAQAFVGSVTLATMSASGAVKQSLAASPSAFGVSSGGSTSLSYGVRFRSSTGTHSLQNGFMAIFANPI